MTRHEHDNRIDTDDRLALRQREQLSALVDGELPADQARFLLRRLAHDADLAGRMERWQLAGDLLRGVDVRAVHGSGLAARVAAAVADEPAPTAPTTGVRWQRIGGLAAAAAIAAIAVGLVRPALDAPATDAAAVATLPVDRPMPVTPDAQVAHSVEQASVPQFADVAPAREVPAVATPSQPAAVLATRDTTPAQRNDPDPIRQVPPATAPDPGVPLLALDDLRPFASPAEPVEPRARPWPRATLPGLQAPGYTVGFDEAPAPSFYPFDPRLPEDPETANR